MPRPSRVLSAIAAAAMPRSGSLAVSSFQHVAQNDVSAFVIRRPTCLRDRRQCKRDPKGGMAARANPFKQTPSEVRRAQKRACEQAIRNSRDRFK